MSAIAACRRLSACSGPRTLGYWEGSTCRPDCGAPARAAAEMLEQLLVAGRREPERWPTPTHLQLPQARPSRPNESSGSS
jgi:hypothetical protein